MSEYRNVLERSRDRYRPELGGFERLRRRRDRKRRNERIAAAALALILAAAALGGAVSILRSEGRQTPAAPTVTTVRIATPQGNAFPDVPPLDIVSAAVSKNGNWFDFEASVSAPISPSLEIPRRYDAFGYEFCIDTDRSMAPAGYPFGTATTAPCEFIVMAMSTGKTLEGTLIDRRPLNDLADVVTSSVAVTISGTKIVASLPASSLDDPASFDWIVFTSFLSVPLGTDRYINVDEAPSLDRPAPWPSP